MFRSEKSKLALQTICVIIVSIGIVIEAYYKADIGYILLNVGALSFAISTKINNRKVKGENS